MDNNLLNAKTLRIGLGLSVAFALGSMILCLQFFFSPEIGPYALFHAGTDVLGAFVCAVLFYGCMGQIERTTRSFSLLLLMANASFFLNELIWFICDTARWRGLYFGSCMLSKWLNLVMIYLFFLYVRETLHFSGTLARWADKGLPILLIISVLIVFTNVFFPVSFLVDVNGVYSQGALPWLEDLYLIIAASVTTILIVSCDAPRRQKWAAMSFILIPVAEFLISGGAFAYATQYGAVLLSLILMYSIIFNDRSRKLASTQTELMMANRIQESMLPSIFPTYSGIKEFELCASMNPAKEVGGDFYDFFKTDEDHLALVIADVSGKGVPAALFMMISMTIIRNYAKLGIGAAEIMTKVNEALCADTSTDMFVTAWIGILEISTGKMTCANAGHEYPVVCRNNRYKLLKDKHCFVLGGMQDIKYSEYTIQLEKGDKVFVYTDGVPEAENEEHEMFGTEKMLNALNRTRNLGPGDILKTVRRSVDNFVGRAEQFDDMTMLCLEYRG